MRKSALSFFILMHRFVIVKPTFVRFMRGIVKKQFPFCFIGKNLDQPIAILYVIPAFRIFPADIHGWTVQLFCLHP